MTRPALIAPLRLHEGHPRLLRLLGTLRQSGRALKADAFDAEWEAVEAVKAAAEEGLIAQVQSLFIQLRSEVLRRLPTVLADLGITKQLDVDPDLLQGLFDVAVFDPGLRSATEAALPGIYREGFLAGGLRVGLPADPSLTITPRLQSVIDAVVANTSSVSQTTLRDLGRQIGAGLEAGETLEEITRRIEGYFDAAQSYRAALVARTASQPAFEIGQQAAFQRAGVSRHAWLSQRDGNVRETHAVGTGVDGEIREIGQAFSNGLAYPGDPLGAPQEILGCRCTTRPIFAQKALTLITPDDGDEPESPVILYASTQFALQGKPRRQALAMAAGIRDEDLAEDGREDEPHVTVRFGILPDGDGAFDPKPVRDAVAGFGPVELVFGQVSLFKNDAFDVVKLEVHGDRLYDLHDLIAAEVPGDDTHASYQPHLTLAYVKPGRGWMYLAMDNPLQGTAYLADALAFSAPGDAGYEQTAIPLGEGVAGGDGLAIDAGSQIVRLADLNDTERQRVELGLRDYCIRQDHAAGEKNLSTLAERYCVSEATVRRAIWG